MTRDEVSAVLRRATKKVALLRMGNPHKSDDNRGLLWYARASKRRKP